MALPDETDLDAWLAAVARLGLAPLVLAAHAAAAPLAPLWDERPDAGIAHLGEASPGEQLAAVAEWLACPCEEHVAAALSTLPPAPRPSLSMQHGDEPWAVAHDVAEQVVLSLRRPSFAAVAVTTANRLDAAASERARDAVRRWAAHSSR